MFFAPPVKVPRTQRLTLSTSGAAPSVYRRATEGQSELAEAPPASLDDAVFVDASTGCAMPAASFLSGAGTHMCWLVDENKKLLRLWNVSRPGWQSAAPRLAEIPYFAAAREGLPLLVSEMHPEEESLAFCSERGAISSLDHSIEVQMMDSDNANCTASSFVCARRRVGGEAVVVTVLGTTAGVLLVDLKYDGTHTTAEFNRRDPASMRWAGGSQKNNNNIVFAGGHDGDGGYVGAEEEEDDDKEDKEDAARAPQRPSGGLWNTIKSLVGGHRGGDRRAERVAGVADMPASDADGAVPVWPLSAAGRDRRGDGPLAFTHVHLRHHYPEQVLAVNAAGEVFLLDVGPLPPTQQLSTRGATTATTTSSTAAAAAAAVPRLSIKWATSLPVALKCRGSVVSCSETRHRVCLLYHVRGSRTRPLPALWLVTLDATLGRVVNYVVLNAVADVVSAAARLPPHHVKIFSDDVRREVLISVGAYLLRVNNQVGVRQPCSSEDTVCFSKLEQPVASLLRSDGSLVTLDAHGPQLTVRDVLASRMTDVAGGGEDPRRRRDGADSGELELQRIVDAVRNDAKLSLDGALLCASEALAAAAESLLCGPHGGGGGTVGGEGNWARCDLNAEDENIVVRVTRRLTAQQQSHRRFLLAILRDERIRAQVSPATVAQLLSTQEMLASLCALRSMQNVGLQAEKSASTDSRGSTQRTLPSFSAMPVHAAPGGTNDSGGGGEGAGYLVQRHASTQDGARLLKSAEQLERCQQILRRAVVAVAEQMRAAQKSRACGEAPLLTAAEICFAAPANVVRLLHHVGAYMSDVRQTVALSLEEKFAECYAAGCIYVVVAQTVVESREDVRGVYDIADGVLAQMWTSSAGLVDGVEACFSGACAQLSNALAEVCDVASSGDGGSSQAVFGTAVALQHRCDMLDVVAYLLYFSLSNNGHHDARRVASVVTATLLREPFTAGPVGYPYGAPTPAQGCHEIGRRVMRVCETLALRFDVMPVLMMFALSTPVDDPASTPELYEQLQRYCQRNSNAYEAALQTLWDQGREWELLSLPAVLPAVPDARARRTEFLEAHAPHLLWLADPTRYDALASEGATCPPYIAYGDTQLAHRTRCNAVARLAWIAGGAAPSSRMNAVQLSDAIVAAQQTYLTPATSSITLGPQAAVQRLLEMQDCVAAWAQAAVIACHTMHPTSEDLLVQVLRRCRVHDGAMCLQDIFENSVSERETDTQLRQTALGQAVLACAALQDAETLRRVCETLLTAEELALLSSWLGYVWAVNREAV
ncbi:hypothetical protein NESM_000588100 [Novymonas esmeraldas]|uniref:Uncharacterized protein n=1 Tax=Novymonas esmeraldas TaxID=1808958 RepID=A0AAW0ETW7_9TRYP